MTDIRDRLREADPVLTEPALARDEVAAMRRRVLETAHGPRVNASDWKRTLAFAAAGALVAGAGIDTARRVSRPVHSGTAIESSPRDPTPPVRTQLQFSTPGGTRIVWTIDPAFQLTEKR
jgi:hypothetical protein